MPPRYRACAKLTNLPKPAGGWTRASAIKALGLLQVSEVEKHDCLNDLADWADQQLDSVRGTR